MDYVIERTHVIDHERFLEAGPHARDLWEWGMKYSGKFELDGAIPMAAVLASPWGYGGKANIKAASKLVEVGLWERTDRGFLILRWTEQGNKTHAELEVTREVARKKKATQRANSAKRSNSEASIPSPLGTPEGTPQGTPEGVLNSPSLSVSRLGSLRRDQEPDRSSMPEWVDSSIEAVSAATGETFDRGVVWTTYQGSRESTGRPTGAPDFRKFLGSWASRQKSDRVNARDRPSGTRRGAEITKQPFDENAPWMKAGA